MVDEPHEVGPCHACVPSEIIAFSSFVVLKYWYEVVKARAVDLKAWSCAVGFVCMSRLSDSSGSMTFTEVGRGRLDRGALDSNDGKRNKWDRQLHFSQNLWLYWYESCERGEMVAFLPIPLLAGHRHCLPSTCRIGVLWSTELAPFLLSVTLCVVHGMMLFDLTCT